MNNKLTVVVIVEGPTEKGFVNNVLAPEFGAKNIFFYATIIGKDNHKGGDVKFDRVSPFFRNFLKQRADTIVTTMFDFFRIDTKWPGISDVTANMKAHDIGVAVEKATYEAVKAAYPDLRVADRLIPYISMHEFEALLFSSPEYLALGIDVEEKHIQNIVDSSGEPEEINTGPETAPAKRIQNLCPRKYKKTIEGPNIAQAIGLETIRQQCPHFNSWLVKLEALVD
ncbi:DUF4276 family protein [Pseudodesulfovibrio sp. JC047]|uniref:DUF4276 family protein n=1 Tax=Pseudodesulfovibrio sp. JC047 TaxID=2683199 RepID=UPI0013D62AD1|nr:DUF4276 family protein [Pseudodesulfovibrio sp. JC047]NDV20224.1 DUF4276 family protein [Pseudodesulfovibrio sp. JC047]